MNCLKIILDKAVSVTFQYLDRTPPIILPKLLSTPSLPGEKTLISWENLSQNRVVHYNPSTFHTMAICWMLVDDLFLSNHNHRIILQGENFNKSYVRITHEVLDLAVNEYNQYSDQQYSVHMQFFFLMEEYIFVKGNYQ